MMGFLSYNKYFIWCSIRPVMQLLTRLNRNATAFSLRPNTGTINIFMKLLHFFSCIKNFWIKVAIQALVFVSTTGSFLGDIGRILPIIFILAMHVFFRAFLALIQVPIGHLWVLVVCKQRQVMAALKTYLM